jgi:hypothetical protein
VSPRFKKKTIKKRCIKNDELPLLNALLVIGTISPCKEAMAKCSFSPIFDGKNIMRRTSIMTLGLVLIFIGIQLNLVDTYVLTPRFSNLLADHATVEREVAVTTEPVAVRSGSYYPASYANNNRANEKPPKSRLGVQKTISTPTWLCWPILFLGTVVFLNGFSIRRE